MNSGHLNKLDQPFHPNNTALRQYRFTALSIQQWTRDLALKQLNGIVVPDIDGTGARVSAVSAALAAGIDHDWPTDNKRVLLTAFVKKRFNQSATTNDDDVIARCGTNWSKTTTKSRVSVVSESNSYSTRQQCDSWIVMLNPVGSTDWPYYRPTS